MWTHSSACLKCNDRLKMESFEANKEITMCLRLSLSLHLKSFSFISQKRDINCFRSGKEQKNRAAKAKLELHNRSLSLYLRPTRFLSFTSG